MAKFHIGTPAGYDVEVTAGSEQEALSVAREKWQTLPRVIAQTGDKGRVLEQNGHRFFVSPGFSTSDPDRIAQIMQGASPGELSRRSFDEQAIAAAPIAARATKFVEGVPFAGTFVDEALGAALGPEAKAGIRAQSAAMERQRPGQSLLAALGGGVAGTVGAVGAMPARATQAIGRALPTVAQGLRTAPGLLAAGGIGSATGAIEGAVAGAGMGTDPESRARMARTGGQIGAVAGGAFGAAAPLLTKAADNVVSLFRRSDVASISRDLGISSDAARVIKNTFDQGGDMAQAQANLQRAGSQAMLADAGEAAQALLDAAAASGGTASQTVRGAIDARASRTAAALDQTLDQTLGKPPVGPQTAVSDIARRTAPQRAEAYERAFDNVIDYNSPEGRAVTEALSRISPKVLNDAIEEANEQLLASGQSASRIRASLNKAGEVVLSDNPSVRQLNEIKIALGSLAEDAKGDLGAATTKSRRFSALASGLRKAIGDAAPDYSRAVQLGGDAIAERNAFELGASLLKPQTRIEDVTSMLGDSPSLAQIDAAKSGLRDAINKALGDVRAIASDPNMDARQLRQALQLLGSDNAKAKARELLGSEADALFAQIAEAEQSLLVRSATARGSQTAARQAQQRTVEEITSPGLLGTAMRGEPIDASKRLVQAVTGQTDEFSAEQRQRIFADISRALTSARGDEARKALSSIDRAISGQSLTEAQTNQIAKALVDVGFTAGTPAATRGLLGEERRLAQ